MSNRHDIFTSAFLSLISQSVNRWLANLPCRYFASEISTLPTRLMASASILASLSQNF